MEEREPAFGVSSSLVQLPGKMAEWFSWGTLCSDCVSYFGWEGWGGEKLPDEFNPEGQPPLF